MTTYIRGKREQNQAWQGARSHRNKFCLIGAIVFMGIFLSLAAQAAAPILTVSTDHSDALYKVGETATFIIRVEQDQKPVNSVFIQWTLTKDGGSTLRNGLTRMENGEMRIPGTMDEPGFVQLTVTTMASGQTLTAKAGAGFDPLHIAPSMPVPADFDAFWNEKKALLAAVPLHAQVTPISSGYSDLAAFDVNVDSLGAPVSGYLARPVGAKPHSLPAIITLHGAGVVSSSLTRATSWAKEGMLALDINAHGIPNGKPSSYYTELSRNALANYYTRGWQSKDEFYFLGMFLRVIRAIDFVTSQPEWDGRTLILYGTSQGGAQSYAGAGLDARVSFFVAGVSAMADLTGNVVNRAVGWPNAYFSSLVISPADQMKKINTVRYFDAMNFATRVKADGFFTVGFVDTTCAPTAVYAAYNNVGTNKAIYNDIKAKHENTPEATRLMKEAVLGHVAKMKQQ